MLTSWWTALLTQIASKFGRLDILVNCAAGNFLATAENLTPNGFRTGTLLTRTQSPHTSFLSLGGSGAAEAFTFRSSGCEVAARHV
eukprot:1160378-Pelagomonas_calceolata.AAC.8